jgi:hypothetical protein
MTQVGMWLLAVMFLTSGLLLIVFLLKNRFEPSGLEAWTIRDVVQLAGVILNIVALAIAVGAIQVAVNSYKENKESGQKQQVELDASRKALEAVVETAQAQQVVLKEQQEQLQTSLLMSKAQLDLIEEQTQREGERLARKPLVALLHGGTDVSGISAPIEIRRGAEFTRVSLTVRNTGDASADKGIVVVIADQPAVMIDRADERVAERRSHHRFETMLPDLRPYPLTQDEFPLQLDLHGSIPDEFALSINIFGENFEAVRRKIAFRVVAE